MIREWIFMRWRLLPRYDADIKFQLAVDEAQARLATKLQEKANTLRFWVDHKSVVIGRLQCVHKEVNFEYCKTNGINIARRFTGGGAVFHDKGNLNFTLCMIQEDPRVPRRLPEVYEKYINGITIGLNEIGIPVKYDENRFCLRIGKKKVTGTAGWMKQGVSFIHGTLLINTNLEMLKKALSPPENQQVYQRDRTRVRCKGSMQDIVTNIADEKIDCPSEGFIIEGIIKGLERTIGDTIEKDEFSQMEVDTAQSLYHSRYQKSEWNLGTPIPFN